MMMRLLLRVKNDTDSVHCNFTLISIRFRNQKARWYRQSADQGIAQAQCVDVLFQLFIKISLII